MTVQGSKLTLLLAGLVLAALVARFCDIVFLPTAHGARPFRYEIVDDQGAAEDSLFHSNKNSKLPVKVLAKAIAAANTPIRMGRCSSTKTSFLSNLLTPFATSAQGSCQSPCQGSYNKTCNVNSQTCPGLNLCCFDVHNEDEGCMGVLDVCRNGGEQCGQSECSED